MASMDKVKCAPQGEPGGQARGNAQQIAAAPAVHVMAPAVRCAGQQQEPGEALGMGEGTACDMAGNDAGREGAATPTQRCDMAMPARRASRVAVAQGPFAASRACLDMSHSSRAPVQANGFPEAPSLGAR